MNRELTKLESKLLKLTPTETRTINEVLAGRKTHPRWFRNGKGQSYELLGMGPRQIAKVLDSIDIRGDDLEYGNDAPRLGITGKWLRLTASGRRKAKRRLA